jgi:hypothetical protein
MWEALRLGVRGRRILVVVVVGEGGMMDGDHLEVWGGMGMVREGSKGGLWGWPVDRGINNVMV